jgi:hypothetical protein
MMLKEKTRDKRVSPALFGADPKVFDEQVITWSSVPVLHDPANSAPIETHFLYGENVKTFGSLIQAGKVLAQSERDGYVGYIDMRALGSRGRSPTHRVMNPRTIVYRRADIKSGMVTQLGFNALVSSGGEEGEFTRIPSLGFVHTDCLWNINRLASDPVDVAELLLDTPYYWAGRDTTAGVDCSAYVQHAFDVCGIQLPRDSDQIARAFPEFLLSKDERPRRGDIVNFPGHLGIMSDSSTILHASEYHRKVSDELLENLVERRLAKAEGGITSIIRFPLMG